MLNETWLREKSNFNVPGFNIILQNGPYGHGGVAILVQTPYDFLQTAT